MDLRQLRYFVAVADASTFGRASTVLGIAQSALSTQIARLEQELGIDLFVRSPRTVTLTPGGRAVLAEARKTLTQADLTVEVARRAARGETGRLRLGYARALPWHLPSRVVKAFTELESGAAIDLLEIPSHAQAGAMRRGEIDAGIFIGPVSAGDGAAKLIARLRSGRTSVAAPLHYRGAHRPDRSRRRTPWDRLGFDHRRGLDPPSRRSATLAR